MTDAQRLAKVKAALGISGTFQDDAVKLHIESVMEFMKDAGVHSTVAESDASVGCIACGVNDLFNYSSGGVKFSEFFKQRVTQLSLKEVEENV